MLKKKTCVRIVSVLCLGKLAVLSYCYREKFFQG